MRQQAQRELDRQTLSISIVHFNRLDRSEQAPI
jgi:hypothetical protein